MYHFNIREKVLLCILAVLIVVSGYVMLFYMPVTEKMQSLESEIENNKLVLTQLEEKLNKQNQMENELKEVFSENSSPNTMPKFDNIQNLMFELSDILENTVNYSLKFSGVDTQQSVVRRRVNFSFTCENYDLAKLVLNEIENSQYRCILEDVNISEKNGDVTVTAGALFFEHQFD